MQASKSSGAKVVNHPATAAAVSARPAVAAVVDPVLRQSEVALVCGISRTTLNRLRDKGAFPRPIRLGANSIGWRASDIQAWLASREEA